MCSNTHLLYVNCAAARIFALLINKISFVQSTRTATITLIRQQRHSLRCIVTVLLAAVLLIQGCALLRPAPGIGDAIKWSSVRGWNQDRHGQAWNALQQSCTRLASRDADWERICLHAAELPSPDDDTARQFFQTHFTPHRVYGKTRRQEALFTGYYEPLLRGSLEPSARYRYPLYARPDDLLTIDLRGLYPQLEGKRIRGRVVGRRVVPYYSRQDLDDDTSLLSGNELLWVDDETALFFLHVQGSGRVRMTDGDILKVAYADQNGHPYVAIGKTLVDLGELSLDEVNLFSIRDWLRSYPERARSILHSNPSYVFFTAHQSDGSGPIGAFQVPLSVGRSIAVDPAVIPLGTPVWIDTRYPGDERRLQRLLLAQDTGGAIRGPLRADIFWGHGDDAEQLAGNMKQSGEIIVLLPKRPND